MIHAPSPLFFCLVLYLALQRMKVVQVCSLIHGIRMTVLLLVQDSLFPEYFQLSRNKLGSALGCELFSLSDLSTCMFPSEMKKSNVPHFEILGSLIGDAIFCTKYVSQKCAIASKLLTQLEEVGSVDPQVALLLLRQCGSFCKLVHLARSTPPSLVAEGFKYFDNDVRHCFALCTGVDTTNSSWEQAQLSLSRGGIGLRSLSDNSAACYIASLSMSTLDLIFNQHLVHSIGEYNSRIPASEAITTEAVFLTPCLSRPFQQT